MLEYKFVVITSKEYMISTVEDMIQSVLRYQIFTKK